MNKLHRESHQLCHFVAVFCEAVRVLLVLLVRVCACQGYPDIKLDSENKKKIERKQHGENQRGEQTLRSLI
jgi:hypothetical protein